MAAQDGGESFGFGEYGFAGFCCDSELEQVGEGRIAVHTALLELGGGKGNVIVAGGGRDGWMIGRVGLDEDPARAVAAAGAAGDLAQDLKGTFGGGEVWELEHGIGANDADGVNGREVEAFGDHLRANDDIDSAVTQALVDGLDMAEIGAVAVEAGDTGLGPEPLNFGFDTFGAAAEEAQVGAIAFGADGGVGLAVIAVVADKPHEVGMEC